VSLRAAQHDAAPQPETLVRAELCSPPPTGTAGIAIVQLSGPARGLDLVLGAMGAPELALGECRLWRWIGVDEVVLARIATKRALVFPHAGQAVLMRVWAALAEAGVQRRPAQPARDIESRVQAALARAASPLAIDLLLEQPARWARLGVTTIDEAAERVYPGEMPALDARRLRRLLEPPTVVITGPPNIGKSSLLNALAGRRVSIVADEPGTTRDHVGVELELAGLVVRAIDAPGVDGEVDFESAGREDTTGGILREAQRLSARVAQSADLVLVCASGRARGGMVGDVDEPAKPPIGGPPTIGVGLRCDVGPAPEWVDLQTSVRTRQGLEALTLATRQALVPDALLADGRAWRFWLDEASASA
jgi:tRNA modification GTPase